MEDLEKRIETYENIFNRISDVVFTMDLDLNTNLVSPSIQNLTGYSPQEYINIPLEKRHTEESVKLLKSVFKEEMENENYPNIDKNRTRNVEVEHYTKDNKIINISINLSMIRDENQLAKEILGVTRDVTEKKEKEKQDEKLLYSMIHDIKSPLSGLIGLNQLIINKINELKKIEGEDLEEIKEYLLAINNSSKLVMNNADLYIDLIKSTKKHEPSLINVYPIINDIYYLQLPNLKKKNINFKNKVDYNYKIYADPNSLNSIFQNLVSNSIKFTNQGGEISILVNELDHNDQIIVSDTGIGIDEKTKQSLYNLGYTTKDLDGKFSTGMGLTIVKNYIDKHGGEINVESELNKGTTFYITLPKYR